MKLPLRTRLVIVVSAAAALGLLLVIMGERGPSSGLRAAFDSEFLTRPDGYRGLKKYYGFAFSSPPLHMDPGLMYRAVADQAVDVICGFATDGRIPAYHLVILTDDKKFFPPYYAAPLVREQTLAKHPEIGEILGRLEGRLSDAAMQGLNYQVDEKGRTASNVARDWLIAEGLLDPEAKPGDGSAGVIRIGGKAFTEQDIIVEIMAILLETGSDLEVERRLGLGGTMICFNALRVGDLDLYPEYTGTALVNILKEQVISDPDRAYGRVKRQFMEKYRLVWLRPFGFNNTYTLTMRKKQAEKLGISTISDLAEHVKREQKRLGKQAGP